MSWRDKLQVGSFRGARFFWQRAEGEVGRKTARHDYPLRDDCYIEDLGMAPAEFHLEVLVLGPDYMTDRDNLVRALRQPGPGTLVHPTMGTLQVAVHGRVRVSEATREGGVCHFTIPFVLAGDNKYPTSRSDTPRQVSFSASALYGQALSTFAKYWWLVRMPAHVIQSGISSILGAADTFLRIGRLVPGIVPDLSFSTEISLLKSSAASLLNIPGSLAKRITAPISALSSLSDNVAECYRFHRALFSFGSDFKAVPLTTASRRRQASNQDALVRLVRLTAITEAAIAASLIDYTSYQDAIAYRDDLCAQIDSEMEQESTGDDVFAALVDLRAAIVSDISERGANLARLISYTPIQTLPALVVAYSLYGDAARADDIIARNHVRHPAFVPGGTPLEVLIDA